MPYDPAGPHWGLDALDLLGETRQAFELMERHI